MSMLVKVIAFALLLQTGSASTAVRAPLFFIILASHISFERAELHRIMYPGDSERMQHVCV